MPRGIYCLMLGLTLIAAPAPAQDFPSKPIRIVVPIAAGGVADIVTRVFSGKVGEPLSSSRPIFGKILFGKKIFRAWPVGG